MKKKKIELKGLEVKSFITDENKLQSETVKGGIRSFFSLFGNTCGGSCNTCECTNYSCGDTCTCQTGCGSCPTQPPCLTTDPGDTVCECQ